MIYSPRIIEAFTLMYELHADQVRKGAGAPYITHLLSVAALVGEHGGDEDQFIAAMLHDAVEDAGGQETLQLIRTRFGSDVAEMVWACSDSDIEPKPPWRARKEQFIASIAGVSHEARLIIAADKLHNIRSTVTDLRHQGDAVWERFTGKREGTVWYYMAMADALEKDWRHPILQEVRDAVEVLCEAAQSPTP